MSKESRIDPLRHVEVFDPGDFNPTRVDIIGCGATGSFVALALARLGITNLHCWDFDTVAEHNIANQAYEQAHIGKPKTEALLELITRIGGVMVPHQERVDGKQKLGAVVFLLTDTMSSRKEIFEGSLKLKLKTKLVIETRMAADEGRLYAFSPMNSVHIAEWEGSLYSDADAVVSACGATTTVGATAMFLASCAVWTMIAWFKKREYDNEVIWGLTPLSFYTRKFVDPALAMIVDETAVAETPLLFHGDPLADVGTDRRPRWDLINPGDQIETFNHENNDVDYGDGDDGDDGDNGDPEDDGEDDFEDDGEDDFEDDGEDDGPDGPDA